MHFYVLFVVVKMRGRPLANDDPKGPASCKWWSEGTGLLQMVIRRGRPLTNDHLEGSSSKRRNWGFQNSWAFICFLREKYTLGEESIIFYVWSHAQSKVYNVKITKPKVKRRLRTRSPLRRYPASFSCDAGKGTKLRGRNLLSFWQLLFLCYFL